MKAVALKMRTYARSVEVFDRGDLRKKIFTLLLLSSGLLGLIYVFLLGSTVSNVIERRAYMGEIRILENEVADMELEYLSSISKIDPVLSTSLGFKEIKANYVTKKAGAAVGSLDISKNEI